LWREKIPHLSIILIVGCQISLQTLHLGSSMITSRLTLLSTRSSQWFDPLVAVLHLIDRLQMNDGDRLDLLVVDRLD
jgi:hypothetical protein